MKNINKILTDTFNKLREEEEEKFEIAKLKKIAKETKTETLKKYISNRKNEDWNYKCSIANDELIKRGAK